MFFPCYSEADEICFREDLPFSIYLLIPADKNNLIRSWNESDEVICRPNTETNPVFFRIILFQYDKFPKLGINLGRGFG